MKVTPIRLDGKKNDIYRYELMTPFEKSGRVTVSR